MDQTRHPFLSLTLLRQKTRWTTRYDRRLLLPPLLSALLLALALCSVSVTAFAQTSREGVSSVASEEQIKAAYLYKFPNYVEWPASSFAKPDSPYVIGVFGDDDIVEELNRITAGRLINNRPVAVRKIQGSESLTGLHILFISRAERPRLPQLAKQMAGQPVLIVTDADGALAQGSIINFRIADDRVRFEVALGTAEKSGLKLSSRLLALALSVTKESLK